MCKRQESWRWRWQSHERGCPFTRPTRSALCARLAGKRILLYGDSLTQQFFVSLASLAGGAAASWRPPGCEGMRRLECVRVCGGGSEPPAELCQRTKFGLALDEPPPRPHNCSVQPSVVATAEEKFPPNCVRRFDVLILSEAAHWVGVDGALGMQQCLERFGATDAARFSQAFVARLYESQMQRDVAHLRAVLAPPPSAGERRDTRVLFRTSPPGYPTADVLPPDTPEGIPPVFTAPSRSAAWATALAAQRTSRYNHHMLPRLNAIARRAFADGGASGSRVGVMDVEAPMVPRVDGHLDPLHYCLPGPADFYAEVLFNFVV